MTATTAVLAHVFERLRDSRGATAADSDLGPFPREPAATGGPVGRLAAVALRHRVALLALVHAAVFLGVFPLAYSVVMPALYPVVFGMLFGLIFRFMCAVVDCCRSAVCREISSHRGEDITAGLLFNGRRGDERDRACEQRQNQHKRELIEKPERPSFRQYRL